MTEERKAYLKAYYKAHKEERKTYQKEYRAAHKTKVNAYGKKYYEDNKAEASAYYKKYYEAHKAKVNANNKKYYEAHKTEVNANNKFYQRQQYCCEDICQIENYELAKKDNFIGWDIHHRLETHNSDGIRRSVDITRKELMKLGVYYNRPASELIFMKSSEHCKLHHTKKH